MLYRMTDKDRELVLTALGDYARACSEDRLMFQSLLEQAEETGEVPNVVAALYNNVAACRSHLAERVSFLLYRQETAQDLLVKIDAGEVVVDYDDSDNPF